MGKSGSDGVDSKRFRKGRHWCVAQHRVIWGSNHVVLGAISTARLLPEQACHLFSHKRARHAGDSAIKRGRTGLKTLVSFALDWAWFRFLMCCTKSCGLTLAPGDQTFRRLCGLSGFLHSYRFRAAFRFIREAEFVLGIASAATEKRGKLSQKVGGEAGR